MQFKENQHNRPEAVLLPGVFYANYKYSYLIFNLLSYIYKKVNVRQTDASQ